MRKMILPPNYLRFREKAMSTKSEIVASIEAAQVELEQALAKLDTLPALDSGTVRTTAHTLGNYLNITSACVQLLQMALVDHPDPEVKMWLLSLERTSELMAHLARQLTNASAATDVPFVPEKVNLAVMARRTAAFYETMANSKKLQILAELQQPADVRGDRIALAAVLDNLLSNAVKYSPPGKRIVVRVTNEPGHVLCTVTDEGPGLSATDQARLFHQGARLSPTPTAGESSTGYGLYIAKRLIERMGGSIWCDTGPGQGCKFSFRLPRFEEDQPRQAV
jgi:signal transduction histidine kinase